VLTVKVKYLGVIIPRVSEKEEKIRIRGKTVVDLVNELSNRHGAKFRNLFFNPKTNLMIPQVMISVNGRLISDLNYFETKLEDEDEVLFFFPVMGG